MRKLKLSTGLHQYTVADLEHLSDMVVEVGGFFGDVFTDATTDGKAVIISGFDLFFPTSSTQAPGWPGSGWLAYRKGTVIINGELLPFESGFIYWADVVFNIYVPYLTITETYRTDNPIVYGNGTSQNVHAIRKAVIGFQASATGSTPSTTTFPANSFKLTEDPLTTQVMYGMDVLRSRLKERVGAGAWQSVGITVGAANWVNAFKNGTHNTSTLQNVRYVKDLAESIWVQGYLNLECVSTLWGANLLAGGYKTIFRMPANMRPALRQEYSIGIQTWDGWVTGLYTIDIDGWVKLQFTTQQAGVTNTSFDSDTDCEIKFHYPAIQ
jgi:hypothetical protein